MYYKLENKKMSNLQKLMSEYKNFEQKLDSFYEGFANLRDDKLIDQFTTSLLESITDKIYSDLEDKLKEITSFYEDEAYVDRIIPYFEENSEGLAIIYHKISNDDGLSFAIPFTLAPVTQGIDKFGKRAIEEVKRLVARYILNNVGVVDGKVNVEFIDGVLLFTANIEYVAEPFKMDFKIYKTIL